MPSIQNIDQDNDLGFEIGGDDANLFELFAKQQQGTETPKPVDIPTNEPSDDTSTDKTPEEEADKDKKPEPVDISKLQTMVKENLKTGKEVSTDTVVDTPTEDEPADAPEENAISIVFNDFKEKGIFQLPEDFTFDGTAEGLQEAARLTVQSQLAEAIDSSIEEAFARRPENADIAKDFIKYLGAGGTVTDFVANNRTHGLKVENLDSEDETVRINTAKTILSNYYRDVNGWTEDRIKRQIERSQAKGEDILVDEARDFFPDYEEKMKARHQQSLKALEASETQRKEQLQQFNTKLAETVDTASEIAGFQLKTKKERQELKDYLFKPTVELNGKRVPQFLADRQKLQSDPGFIAAQALWLRNGMKPNIQDIETKVTSDLEQKLSALQKGKKTQVASGPGTTSTNTNRSTPGLLDFDNLEVVSL